jgi:SAM-dependent methyltransferase
MKHKTMNTHYKFDPQGVPSRKQWFFTEGDDYLLARWHMRNQAEKICSELEAAKRTLRVLEIGPSTAVYHESEKDFTTAIIGERLKKAGHAYRTMDLEGDADFIGNVEQLADALGQGVYFDVIIMLGVIEHVRKPWLVAEQLHKRLHPGGVVYFNTPFLFKVHGPSPDCWRISPAGFESLFEDFFNVETSVFPEGEDGKNTFPLMVDAKITRLSK